MNSFLDKLTAKWNENRFVCIGLDNGDFEFNKTSFLLRNKNIVDQTSDLVCAYKPNSAFYEAKGVVGLQALKETISYIQQNHPDISTILDAKRGDIKSTNEAYIKAVFDNLGVDAVTVSPYLGQESLKPFLERTDKGILVLVKTSNPGAGEFQDLLMEGKPLYQVVAEHVKSWNTNGNCGVVVGATYPEELKKIREIVGDMPILVPGIGTQGGDLEATIKNGLNSQKQGLIISSSRGIIFASDPRKATQDLHSQIQEILEHVQTH